MNVFVLCTGRCGSTSLAAACEHITNFTSGHETRAGIVGPERTGFPDAHIEIDNRLSWYLGRIDETFGKEAYYVHLKRNFEEVVQSYSLRTGFGIMNMFQKGMLIGQDQETFNDVDLSRDICNTIEANIRHFLKDKPNQMEMHLETIQVDFERFWDWIGAEGNYEAAAATFANPTNTTANLFEKKSKKTKQPFTQRALRKIFRVIQGIPGFVADA